MVEAAMVAGFAFARNEGVNVGGNLDLRAAIVTAPMGGEQIGTIENAYLPGIGPYRECALHMGVRDRVTRKREKWTSARALKILESAGCLVSIKSAEKMDTTTVGMSIFSRKFRS
ncbi:hypothetical protein OMK73_00065 [Cupriavidus sp. D39]|nr:hypothetical protein [Cupriavidus sp. D39]MCY0852440.1 hypothetical protein [Cupriavidus sp. D39]